MTDWRPPPGFRIVESDLRVLDEPFSTHLTRRSAERMARKWNERRAGGLLSYRYEVERKRFLRWEVWAYQNLLERA